MLESIRFGSTGDAVRAWQYFLLGLGLYKGEVTGAFEQVTEWATKKYQSKRQLKHDGWVGKDTYAAALLGRLVPRKDGMHFEVREVL